MEICTCENADIREQEGGKYCAKCGHWWMPEHGSLRPGQHKPRQQPVRAEKVGRNDACPCGSREKYKRCCGRVAVAIEELSPAAAAGAPLPSPAPEEKFAPAAAASIVAPSHCLNAVSKSSGCNKIASSSNERHG